MTSSPGTDGGPTAPPEQAMWLIVGSMATALVVVGGVLALIGAELLTPPLWMLLVIIAATAGAWLLVVTGPVPSVAGDTSTAGVVTPVVIMRAALLEAPAVLGLVLAFISDPMNLTVYVVPALFAVAGMWLFARPEVVRSRLERDRHPGGPRSSL